jgi:CubicO group peptidase (beta-lactamase class C family)
MNLSRRHSLGSLVCLGWGASWSSPSGAQGSSAQRPEAAVAGLLATRLGFQGVGLVAVQAQGRQLGVVAAGRRHADRPEALGREAVFEIGSVTKTFTALLLADAVLRKTVALDGAVEEALPGIPLRDSAGEPIRWVDLATHRSGLPRLPTNLAPARAVDPYADYGEAALFEFLRSHRPAAKRQAQWDYSNLGYGLLGHALGLAAKSSFEEILRERVLDPLGLASARLARRPQPHQHLAQGHGSDGKPVPHWHFDAMAPAGALLMNGADLGRYAQAAIGVLDTPLAAAFALTQREHGAGPTPHNATGLGWIRAELNGRPVLNHDGGTFGFSTSLWLDPTRQRAAAVLANAMVEVNDLALHLLDPAVPAKELGATQQAEVSLGAEQLAPLVGSYALNPSFKIVIQLRDGSLFAQATGQQAFPLFASAPRRFFARITPLEIEFDEGTTPMGLTLKQGAQTLRFLREP